ncbi:MAG TPA: bifunctional 4-hydroxy-2-oxoglutarate aldolase/2-dehydro-3-deoxy-phosphogluconate aldolase [Steroidobacteraceae bacterium]|nr:bifunctional 4-hydroxy-2-oxoglutarate aldolase/2-dehydro-3-deoxy-phosphogluconate aldolase [Steroidobacteraceae bacterium]
MIESLLRRSPVIPVVTIEDATHAVDLARALERGGIRIVEITLRTPAGLAAIEAVARHVPEVVVGAGTVLSPADLSASAQAGAGFAISPGATRELLAAARASQIPYLPAIATASELMQGLDAGYQCFKFFPAAALGGAAALRALVAPFPKVLFCPTGGVSLDNAGDYLAIRNVPCVGGSWLAPAEALRAKDWRRIETLAREAVDRLSMRAGMPANRRAH